jgi:hypothetical protein
VRDRQRRSGMHRHTGTLPGCPPHRPRCVPACRPWKYDESVAPLVEGMTDQQRFLFDLNGFLFLDGALSPEELASGQAAIAEWEQMPPPKPDVWNFNKSMEALCFHRSLWPIVMELTNGKPKLKGGQFINDNPMTGSGKGPGWGGHLHCARTDFGPESATWYTEGAQLRSNDMIIFIYFTEVREEDGALASPALAY